MSVIRTDSHIPTAASTKTAESSTRLPPLGLKILLATAPRALSLTTRGFSNNSRNGTDVKRRGLPNVEVREA